MPGVPPSDWLAGEWARQLTGVVESMLGAAPSITFAPAELTHEEFDPAGADLFWWEQRFSLAQDCLLWVGAASTTRHEIGNGVLKGAGVDDGDAATVQSTYLEIVSQTLAGLAGAFSARVRQEVSPVGGKEGAPSRDAGVARSFEIKIGELTLPLLVLFSGSLVNLPETPQPAPSAAPNSTPGPAPPPLLEGHSPQSIDLLLDVELPVSISFGRAQLPLKDVIKLTTGSIVELNRALSEPVEVIVNNCVIARGEVVVVEGNYGIRIKQVISRQERLRTLS